ncbi:histidine phosphatase family protein [Paenibacillus daejeonensis]|uniref:histidine phosphatase family protein n=1 Tax=Paenibacillus daejeonensis TaxID=135193 RepID=UPI001FE1A1AA|nr:histidine phosphatase family protein [Paenibacillus daejeonensis]
MITPPLLLLRHGQTRWNKERRYLGRTNQPLSPEGIQGLEPVRAWLQGRRLACTYCSDLLRARQTLDVLELDYPGEISYEPRLRELDFGVWEGKTYNDLQHDEQYRQWLDDPSTITPPGGESLVDFRARVTSWLAEVQQRQYGHSTELPILVVAHGGSIRMLVSLLQPGHAFWDIEVPTGTLIGWSPAVHKLTPIL